MHFALAALASLAIIAGCTATTREDAEPVEADAVDVAVHQIYDTSDGAAYAEGAYSFIRAQRDDGATATEVRLEDIGRVAEGLFLSATTLRLAPGKYRLVSFQRACSGNCGHLDPPSEECSADVTVRPSEPLAVTVVLRLPEPCAIEVTPVQNQRATPAVAGHVRKAEFPRYDADSFHSVSCTSERIRRRPTRCRVKFASAERPTSSCDAVYVIRRDLERVRVRRVNLKCLL